MEYTIYDESKGQKAPQLMHDASRPYVVMRETAQRPRLLGRYRLRSSATAAIRRDRKKRGS
jgi:hypothetical protein